MRVVVCIMAADGTLSVAVPKFIQHPDEDVYEQESDDDGYNHKDEWVGLVSTSC